MPMYSKNKPLALSWLHLLLFGTLACASAPTTHDLAGKANEGIKWELITVQPDFVGKANFLAISEMNGQVLAKPWIFGIDVVRLPPGEHQLKIALGQFGKGQFDNYLQLAKQLAKQDSLKVVWQAELGTITLKEPRLIAVAPNTAKDTNNNTNKGRKSYSGRNYLVASYDKIYASNSQSPKYMQRWLVNYPRTIEADKTWSIEPLDPTTEAPQTAQSPAELLPAESIIAQ